MGSGTSSGVQTPEQPGVIVRDGENFPIIPKYLLELAPDVIQKRINNIGNLLEHNRSSILPDLKLEERLETSQVVLEFAKTAVERQRQAVERG